MSRLNGFLSGVRVLDLSRHLPGPLATLFLADMGAEVIKIEPPAGDPLREMSPLDDEGRPVYFDAVNAGKVVRRIDLAAPDGRAALVDLARTADVLLESFRPGTMERLGVGFEVLRAANHRLICCSLTGYGRTSPAGQAAGHDLNYLAGSGTLHRQGASERLFEPPMADSSGALFAVASILGALRARDCDGSGCEIEIALADVMMPLQLFQLAEYSLTKTVPAVMTGPLSGGLACYGVYTCADGRHVALAALEPKFWIAFCQAAGRADWVPRHADAAPQRELKREVADFFAGLTLAEVVARFATVDCCLSPVLDLGEAVDSEHHRARGLLSRSADARIEPLFPALVDGEPPSPRRPLRD